MKKILLLFILAIPLTVFSQSKKSIDGFLDIPFGSDSAAVKNAIIGKGGTRIDSLCKKDVLAFRNFTFSGRKILGCAIKFTDNKAYEADFLFGDFSERDALDYYDGLSADIKAVYGKGTIANNFGDQSNPTRILRLKSGKDFCNYVWEAKNKNTILLQFASDGNNLQIILEYQDSALWDANAAKRRSDL